MLEFSTTTQCEPSAKTAAEIRGRATFFTGVFTGFLLIVVMLAALVAANRIPALEQYALERNAISYTLFVLLMLAPVCRFRKSSLQMFLSANAGLGAFCRGIRPGRNGFSRSVSGSAHAFRGC